MKFTHSIFKRIPIVLLFTLFLSAGIWNVWSSTGSRVRSLVPNQPTNPTPTDASTTVTLSPNLCASVSSTNAANMRVRFYGRKKPAAGSGKFTVIMLPDTQYYTEEPQGNHDGGITAMYNAQTAWIVANRVSKNIVFVGGLGDCVEKGDDPVGTNEDVEWLRVVAAIAPLESPAQTGLPQGIPFGLSVGNHDQTPNGSAAGATMRYNNFFGSNHFAGRSYYGGHYGTNNDNHYELFSASGVDFLVISFEFDQLASFSAVNGPLDWAEGLVQTHSNRKVIVMTHYGINENQTFSTQGQAIYTRLKAYPNFMLLTCGHVHTTDGEARRSDVFMGNTVHTLLSDYQGTAGGGNGQLRIYEFDPQQNTLSAKTYSPYTNTSQTDADSQFTLPFNMGAYTLIGEISSATSGSNVCVNWPNLTELSNYEWFAELFDGTTTTFGPLWTFTTPPNPPLPVNLISFTATPEAKKLRLNWRTSSEINNHHFEIERSLNGIDYTKLAEVPGFGNSSIPRSYLYYDNSPARGRSWYRLKQVDVDSHFKYSNVLTVNYKNDDQFEVSPNPVQGSRINLFFAGSIKGDVNITVYDANGKEMYRSVYRDPLGNIKLEKDLAAGIYTVQVNSKELNRTEKVIITGGK